MFWRSTITGAEMSLELGGFIRENDCEREREGKEVKARTHDCCLKEQ